jgi:hypothetical protein
MYGELATVRGIVDLSPQAALDESQAFLTRLGYATLRRTDTSLTVERRSAADAGQNVLKLTVETLPQPEGGVQIKIRGNDQEGVQARQAEWLEWSESLPEKKQHES